MSRVISILIAMLATAAAAAGVRLPSGAEQFGSLDNVVAYFQRVSSAAGTGTTFRDKIQLRHFVYRNARLMT